MGWQRLKKIGAVSEGEMHPIFDLIEEIWNEFDNRSTEFGEWEDSENLSGLVSGLDGRAIQRLAELKHHEHFRAMPPEMLAFILTTFITGIRLGNALASKRITGEY